MRTKMSLGGGRRGSKFTALALVLAVTLAGASAVLADNGVNAVLDNGVSAADIRLNGQMIPVFDPSGEITHNGNPIQFWGYDYGTTYLWLRDDTLYVGIETYGNPFDLDADGSHNNVGGACAYAVGVAGDIPSPNLYLSTLETVLFQVNRDCTNLGPGPYDLTFRIGASPGDPDVLRVTADNTFDGSGPTGSGYIGEAIGGFGTGWTAAPMVTDPAIDCNAERKGVILFRIPSWSKYFIPAGETELPGNVAPSLFDWRVDGGGIEDTPGEDEVMGSFNDIGPELDIDKVTSTETLCNPGGVATFTITVSNTGNTPVTGIVLTDDLPGGLAYNGNYQDDPSDPIGDPLGPPSIGFKGTLTWPSFDLGPGESITISYDVEAVECEGSQVNTASAEGVFAGLCLLEQVLVGPVTDDATVSCVAACVDILCEEDATFCAGVQDTLLFTVENCNAFGLAQDFSFTGTFNGLPPLAVIPTSADDVAAEGTVEVRMVVLIPTDCSPDGYDAVLTATGWLSTDQECSDAKSCTTVVHCDTPDVEIVKTATPTHTTSSSTIEIVVTNPSGADLYPVVVMDKIPAALAFDNAQLIGGTCGATLEGVATVGDFTEVTFGAFGLPAGESCTITYEVDCTQFDGADRIDTAFVSAWCDGTFGLLDPVADSDTALVVCTPSDGEACPRTIGFWRQQCAQKGNGSTKLEECQMEVLWECVLDRTGVVEWKMNDGSYTPTADLASYTPAQLFDFFCSQLQGPRPMTIRDMAELQYLALMLNTCSPALPLEIEVDNAFSGTVGEAIAEIEEALNSGEDVDFWKGVADDINNGLGLLAGECEDPDGVYDEIICLDGGPVVDQSLQLSWNNPDLTVARAYPNPLSSGSGAVISFNVPTRLGDADVTLIVFDITGRVVRSLVSGTQGAGMHSVTWNLTDDRGQRVPRGVYFYRFTAGSEEYGQRILVMRD